MIIMWNTYGHRSEQITDYLNVLEGGTYTKHYASNLALN